MKSPAGRLLGGTLLLALLSACDDDPVGSQDRERPTDQSVAVIGDALATRRVDVDVHATGAFRPGAPIVVTSNARARYGSDVQYDLVVLDADPPAAADAPPPSRTAATFRGTMGRGNQRQLTATITFPRAGYYRVLAVAQARPTGADSTTMAGDSVLIEGSSETLYILVTENGGRLTDGYDPAAVPDGRQPLFGSYGPFIGTLPQGAGASSSGGQTMQVNVSRGMFWYWHEVAVAHRPVPNALIAVQCVDAARQPVGSVFTTATRSDGSFSFSCTTGLYRATIHLQNTSVRVTNQDGSVAGVNFTEAVGANPSLQANNYYAGHVFWLLNRYVPVAEQRFGVKRTAQLPIRVSTGTTDTTNYFPNEDLIRQNKARVFHEYGTFVTVHEYGHAFHWKAIEKPASYYCNPQNQHSISGQYNFNCAFVEGFADFFAMWVAGDSLRNSGSSDWALEVQTWYSGKDGAQVEGAVAGFLYDLVDGPSDPDGYNNTPLESETWDLVTYPGSFIALTMRECELSTSTTTFRDLYGSDDLVYCLENSLTARADAATFNSPWYNYAAVNRWVANPSGFSQTAVRRLWRANFYGNTQ